MRIKVFETMSKFVLAMLVGLIAMGARAEELELEGRWLERYNNLKEMATKEFLLRAPRVGETVEFVTRYGVTQKGKLLQLEADRFVIEIRGKETMYRPHFLSEESAGIFFAGPYADHMAREQVKKEMEEEQAAAAAAAEAAERAAAEEKAKAEQREKFLSWAEQLAESEGKSDDLAKFVQFGGTKELLKALPMDPERMTDEEMRARDALLAAFTKMHSATDLGVTKARYSELLVDLATTYKIQQRKLPKERFCRLRLQCIIALSCYIKAGAIWESYFRNTGSDKKVFVSSVDMNVLKSVIGELDVEFFRQSGGYYSMPYDIMLSMYWGIAGMMADQMME